MSKHIGRRGTLVLAKETSRGTATLANPLWFPRSTISFDDKTITARQDEGLGKLADGDARFVVGKMAEGDIEFDITDKEIGIILTSLLGASPVITGANPYTHTFTLSNSNQHQSLSVFYQDPDTAKLFPLGVVSSLKITVEPGAIVKGTITFMSRSGRDWTAQTATFTSIGNKFLHQHMVLKFADTIGGLAAATGISAKKLELTISANTKFDTVIGTVEAEDILGQEFSVEGALELNKEDETYRNYMLNGTYKAMDLSFIRTLASSSWQMQFPRIDFSEWEQDRSLNSIVSQKVNLKANYDATNALEIISTCVLINNYIGTAY